MKANVEEKFEEALIQLLGHEAIMGDKVSPHEIARRFFYAGYRAGDDYGFTMGRRNGQ